MLGWAVEAGHMAANPVRDVRRIKFASEGFHTWTLAEVKQFQERHPVGSKARLALELLLLTGARRGDVVTFWPPARRQGRAALCAAQDALPAHGAGL